MKPAPTIRRDSDLATRVFPFELLYARGAATNMRAFHWHDFVELSFVRSGRGTYEIEDKTFRVGPGDVVIINDTERHRVTYRASEPLPVHPRMSDEAVDYLLENVREVAGAR